MSPRRSVARKAAAPAGELLRAWRAAPSAPARARADGASAAALAGAARSLAAFGARRRAGQVLLRVLPAGDEASPGGSVIELVTDDMPFLVDTLTMTVAAAGHTVLALLHPILAATRDGTGRLAALATPAPGGRAATRGTRIESWQRVHVSRLAGEAERIELERALLRALAEVRVAVADWQAMRAEAQALRERSRAQPGPLAAAAVGEGSELLRFMLDDHFTFLGYRRSVLRAGGLMVPEAGTGLGILREGRGAPRPGPRALPIGRHARSRDLVVVTKSNLVSRVHRPGHLDYVGVKLFDARGRLCGEARFVGLWSSSAWHAAPAAIPLVRTKVREVAAGFRFRAGSHDARRLAHFMASLPRDELFQATVPELRDCVRKVLALQDRPRSQQLVLRRDEFGRFWSALLYVGRDHLDNEAVQRIQHLVRAALGGGSIDASIAVGDAPLARLYFTVRGGEHGVPAKVDHAALEAAIGATLVSWRDRLRDALLAHGAIADVRALEARYAGGWPAAYQQETPATQAVQDLLDLDTPAARGAGHLRLAAVAGQPGRSRLRLLRHGEPLAISVAVPLLGAFGLRLQAERPYRLVARDGSHAWVQDIDLDHASASAQSLALLERELASALPGLVAGELDSDGFHRLVLAAGLPLARVRVLRACCRYLLQTGLPFSQATLERTLSAHPGVARGLWELFSLRLDPDREPRAAARAERAQLKRLHHAIGAVTSPEEDRILRACLAVVQAVLRTNFWQERAGAALALKLDPHAIPGLPEPRPAFEVFVHGTRVEGVHMRKGPIARGGLRWSERPEDFRTEVLGLVKAQHVKNTLIVPVGAKGGFIARRLRAGAPPAERAAEVKACYQAYIRALLDITDNIVDGRVVPPPRLRRRDGDDPYLVVAADKGTATFSDVANAISAEYGFWLGDAFASGGSAGYDHKAMGITARGGWECVARHFRELGVDVARDAVTAVGIGDMSGDVFGNGLLLSRSLRLVAAFDHRHVFIDPDPDPARSFRERQRLFALPGSSWDDYDRKAISAGGGVYPRSAKQLALAPQARALLGLASDRATPVEVVRAILKAPVDLLWNGGIGTYVKASDERNAEIGDRGNDAVRIDGRELRARVVGEGGNLGCSQRGRIEYARAGGRINTDFVDNSAGVNTSDIEVNLKIMLAGAGRAAPRGAARRKLLASVTDEVAAQVLRNNYLQSQALSLLERRAPQELGEHQQLLRQLERGELDRAVELLPADGEIDERLQRGQGLVRPELAVLLAYGKIALHHALMQAGIAADPYFAGELERYFPQRWRQRFARPIASHRLRAQLVCTATTNSILNRMDPGFVQRLGVQTGATIGAVARAYTIARDAASLRELWNDVESLDLKVKADAQYDALLASRDYVEQLTRRLLLSSVPHAADGIATAVARLQPAFRELRDLLPGILTGLARERYDALHAACTAAGLPPRTSAWLAALPALRAAPDLAGLAARQRRPFGQVARLYFAVAQRLGVDWLGEAVRLLPVGSAWQSVARERLYTACLDAQRELCRRALAERVDGGAALERWPDRLGAPAAQWLQTLRDLRASPHPELAALMAGTESLRLIA